MTQVRDFLFKDIFQEFNLMNYLKEKYQKIYDEFNVGGASNFYLCYGQINKASNEELRGFANLSNQDLLKKYVSQRDIDVGYNRILAIAYCTYIFGQCHDADIEKNWFIIASLFDKRYYDSVGDLILGYYKNNRPMVDTIQFLKCEFEFRKPIEGEKEVRRYMLNYFDSMPEDKFEETNGLSSGSMRNNQLLLHDALMNYLATPYQDIYDVFATAGLDHFYICIGQINKASNEEIKAMASVSNQDSFRKYVSERSIDLGYNRILAIAYCTYIFGQCQDADIKDNWIIVSSLFDATYYDCVYDKIFSYYANNGEMQKCVHSLKCEIEMKKPKEGEKAVKRYMLNYFDNIEEDKINEKLTNAANEENIKSLKDILLEEGDDDTFNEILKIIKNTKEKPKVEDEPMATETAEPPAPKQRIISKLLGKRKKEDGEDNHGKHVKN